MYSDGIRSAFVTNRPAYYRLPVFQRLSTSGSVRFFFTATDPGRWWTPEHPDSTADIDARSGLGSVALYRELARGDFGCIVCSLAGRSHLAATAAAVNRYSLPLVLWVGIWAYPRSVTHLLGRPLARYLLRRADAIVSYGPHVSAWIARETGRRAGILNMRNAIDNDLFRRPVPPSARALRRSSFGLSTDSVVCFVGRLEPEKGLSVLLQALAGEEGIGVVVIGSGSGANEIRRTAAELGMGHRVHLTGWVSQDDLPEYYAACDALAVPSIATRLVRETWGFVVNEAMNTGLPVVTTDAVGAAAGGLVTHDVTGLVVPERNPVALREALTRLARNPELRSRLGEAGRNRVADYTFDGVAETFREAIQQAVAGRRSREQRVA